MLTTKVWDLYFNGADTLTRLNTELINSSRTNCREEALIFQPRRERRRMGRLAVKTSGAEHIMQNRPALHSWLSTHIKRIGRWSSEKEAWHLPIPPLTSSLYRTASAGSPQYEGKSCSFMGAGSDFLICCYRPPLLPPLSPPLLQLSACSDGMEGKLFEDTCIT